jgi:nucleoid DNA-binding protein
VNKSDLVRAVHEKLDRKIAIKDIDQMVDAMLSIMSEKLKAGEEVQLADFGTFSQTKFAVKPAEVQVRQKRG